MVEELTLYYISRLIANHISKTPKELRRQDLPELFTWIKLTVAMVTDEKRVIEEFLSRLSLLYED
jgi:hypothetical protein